MRRILRPLLDPYRRYRHARLIHAVRVALGLLATILLTTGINLPHGEWASVTMLIVIGGLQHHGNIGKKAVERAYGTLIGASVGLLLVLQQAWLGQPLLTYLLMSVVCGFFSYHAIGKGGYIALLSAITVFIVAGHGDNADLKPFVDGLADAKAKLQEATLWLMQNGLANPDNAGAASTDYLHLMGLTCLAYMWAQMAEAAYRKGPSSDPFLADKIATGRFFLARILPDAAGHLAKLKTGAETLMALSADSF